jgi:hypothetical protein
MKAKACTTCRQRKLKCDAPQKFPESCSRCDKLKKACVFDPNFKRVSRQHRLQQVEQELRSIRQAHGSETKRTIATHILNATFSHESDDLFEPCQSNKQIGNVHMAANQVTDIFQLYFEKLHVYLPFQMNRSIEAIHEVCPLLFWTIIAVSTRDQLILKDLIPLVKQLASEITLQAARSVEIVQALLILCMWPFPYYSQLEDPSFIYIGMATQIGLQTGLHRPEFAFEFSSKQDVLRSSSQIRRTTWIACFIVGQIQASVRGAPTTIPMDYSLLVSLDHADTPVYLAQLGLISRLNATFSATIGFNAHNMHGLIDPSERMNMIKLYDREFSYLKSNKLREMDQGIEVAFLGAQLQLFSFALHDDMPDSLDLVEIVHKAETAACRLIQLVSQSELQFLPVQWSRSVILAAVMLLKILKSPHVGDSHLINNQVTLAHQIFTLITKDDDDGSQRSDRLLLLFSVLEDKKKWPPVQCRLTASLVYDAIRVSKEYYEEVLDNIVNPSDRSLTTLETHSLDNLMPQDIEFQQE